MKKSRFTEAQIIGFIKQAAAGYRPARHAASGNAALRVSPCVLGSSVCTKRLYAHREASPETLLLNLMNAYAFNFHGRRRSDQRGTPNSEVFIRLAVAILGPEWVRDKCRVLVKMREPRVGVFDKLVDVVLEFLIGIYCPAPDAFQGLKLVVQRQVPSDAKAETICRRPVCLQELDGDWVSIRDLQGQAERTFVAPDSRIAHKAASTDLGVGEADAPSGISISVAQQTFASAGRARVECEADNTSRACKGISLESSSNCFDSHHLLL